MTQILKPAKRCLLGVLLILAVPTFLQAGVWQSFSLEGKSVVTLVIDPQTPKNMYALTGSKYFGGQKKICLRPPMPTTKPSVVI